MKFTNLFNWAKKDQTEVNLRELLKELAVNSGVAVNHKTAQQAITAMACARVIGEGLAQIPIKLHKSLPNGGSMLARDHKLYGLVGDAPNDYMTSFEWRETMGLHLVFAGNYYAMIVRVNGKPVELIPLVPKNVTIKQRGVGLGYYYEVWVKDKYITVQPENMLHIKGIAWDSDCGLDGIHLAREAIGLALATEEHGARTFLNGAQANGLLTTEQNLTDPAARKAMRDSWEETHGGLKNTGKTALLWGGLKWLSTSQDNDKAQFLETRSFQVSEVCRWARVLPIMVGFADKAMTFASSEQMFLAHVIHTMGPWYTRIEQRLNFQLLSKAERDEGYYFKFNLSALMRGTHKDRAEYFARALGSGGSPPWMTQDEVRALEELNPMGGTAEALPDPVNIGNSKPIASSEDSVDNPQK